VRIVERLRRADAVLSLKRIVKDVVALQCRAGGLR
jgi:hypothetical protein